MLDNLDLGKIADELNAATFYAAESGVLFCGIFIDGHGTLYSGSRVSYR